MATQAPSTPRRTSLYERHVAAGAKLVEFAGWEMPVQYSDGVRAEHMAVRERCGVFDVSHMGEIEVSGPQACDLLQRLLSNDVSQIRVGGSQYSVLCDERGGVLDDLFTYQVEPDRYLTVTNASNHERDLAWFSAHADAEGFDVQVRDRIDDYAMLAVQGPLAREIVQAISDAPLPARMTAAMRRLSGADVLVCGTGYTGEEGVELLLAPAEAPTLWDELCHRGAVPVGLAARDTLRLEACFHLYGNDLTSERNPIEAGLGWCCREDTGFIGAEVIRVARAAHATPVSSTSAESAMSPAGRLPERLVAFMLDGPGIARQGNPVVGGGEVTSGTLSPCLNVGIGLAYVPAERSAVGTPLQIDVRGRVRDAQVHAKPFIAKRT
ncbi:MAG: glycine cleavage system aminomethyltransferase GcvT [Solirubrobacteraceae bacterium]